MDENKDLGPRGSPWEPPLLRTGCERVLPGGKLKKLLGRKTAESWLNHPEN